MNCLEEYRRLLRDVERDDLEFNRQRRGWLTRWLRPRAQEIETNG